MTHVPNRIYLSEERMPKRWLNLQAVMREKPDPYLLPGSMRKATAEDFYGIFAKGLADQEFNDRDAFIEIPDEVAGYLRMFRPAPLVRAYALERELDTPARIYYKYEGNNSSGSHKLNSAIPQVYYSKQAGATALTTETGAGQWGTALAMAANFFKIPLTVFMVKSSFNQKPHRKTIMEIYGARVLASPSATTAFGRDLLAKHPDAGGSLGCAISEAVELQQTHKGTFYVLGSMMNMVLLHQSIIGLEVAEQLQAVDEYPDVVIGCAGGGSNLGGLIAPFIKDKVDGKGDPRIVAVEPASCPSLTRGVYAYDYGDTGMLTPLCRMYTLGHDFMPSPIHAGGLRFHGMSPIISKLYHDGFLEARAECQSEVFKAAVLFSRTEAIVPAPESAHAVKAAIDEALKCREEGRAKVIVFGLTGHGYLDLSAYQNHLAGDMEDYVPTDEEIAKFTATLPKV